MPLLTPVAGLAIKRSTPARRTSKALVAASDRANLSNLVRRIRQTARIDLPSNCEQQASGSLRVYGSSAPPLTVQPTSVAPVGAAVEIVCVQPQQIKQLLDAIGELSLAEQAVQQSLVQYDMQTGAQRMSNLLRLHDVTRRLQQSGLAMNTATIRSEF